jgi:hypothetical protein
VGHDPVVLDDEGVDAAERVVPVVGSKRSTNAFARNDWIAVSVASSSSDV